MLSIDRLTTEHLEKDCVTDNMYPRFSFSVSSDRAGAAFKTARVSVGEWETETVEQSGIVYGGPPLKPHTVYTVKVTAFCDAGESASREMTFETGKLGTSFDGVWITDTAYRFTQKKASPVPMTFQKELTIKKQLKSARLYATALGIYEFEINGKKAGRDYFAPGFTSYRNQIQYQIYDVTHLLTENNILTAILAGGWAVGKYTHCLKNRIFAKRQALLCELRLEYADGEVQTVGSDESWRVTLGGRVKEADFYDGEVFDAATDLSDCQWRQAGVERIRIKPRLIAAYCAPVTAHETFTPEYLGKTKNGALLYDCKQNFAGVIEAIIKGAEKGQSITFRHAEILMDGELFVKPLRTAKARAQYFCRGDKEEFYSPRFTYMGFRYIAVEGIEKENLNLSARALYSDMRSTGRFSCSDERLNRLQQNIEWSAKSNFIDIPTDCPQRDERMGWTGDIALFSSTASYLFDTSRFYEKWLRDLKSDQKRTGGVPVTIPHVVFPSNLESVFTMAIDHWGDACILVPWAEYKARGDLSILRDMYPSMKRYLKACKFWAGLLSVGRHRRIWSFGHHYGDWCAPNIGLMGWMMRGKWTATACWAYSSGLVGQIAALIGKTEDAEYYAREKQKIADAYRKLLTDGKGRLKKEFQTAYVLPIYYGVFEGEEKKAAAAHLAALVKENDYKIGTGFPGTPYILFALADNGQEETAYRMLLNDACPSWLHQVKAGGTTIWERWDALREDGSSNTGATDGTHGMVSFNHYANGAVGDFFYRRILGIEAVEAGYKTFNIRPIAGGGISHAEGGVQTPFGDIDVRWNISEGKFLIDVTVPIGAVCNLTLPDGKTHIIKSGTYTFSCALNTKKGE